MNKFSAIPLLAAFAIAATPAAAVPGYRQITNAEEFVELVAGKTLTRRNISFTVYADGTIQGNYNGREMVGTWEWVGDAFCRSLTSPRQGYGCQKITSDGENARFMPYPRNGMPEVRELIARNN